MPFIDLMILKISQFHQVSLIYHVLNSAGIEICYDVIPAFQIKISFSSNFSFPIFISSSISSSSIL